MNAFAEYLEFVIGIGGGSGHSGRLYCWKFLRQVCLIVLLLEEYMPGLLHFEVDI
jgi:hypothetical protein